MLPGQRGLATVAQLLERGWTAGQLRAARSTLWQEPMPRVVAPHRGPIDAQVRLVATALWAGPAAVASGAVALRALGLTVRQVPQHTFVIPETGRARSLRPARLVRSARPVEVASRDGVVRFAGAARALADSAVYESLRADDLEHLTIAALQRSLAMPEELERELWLRPRNRVQAVWKGLAAFTQGAWSRPEGVLREIVEGDGGFPPLVTNCDLLTPSEKLIGTPDGYLEEAGVGVQVHSRQYHQGFDEEGGDLWARTVDKDGDFVAAGVRLLGVSPWTLYSGPRRFLTRLHRVVEIGLAGPKPQVIVRRHGGRAA